MMLWQAWLLLGAWAALAAVFAWGWIRGGNGAWRWIGRDYDENTPLFGLLAVVCLTGVAWYSYMIAAALPCPPTVLLYRAVREAPLVGGMLAVALTLRPWGHRP